MTTANGYSDRVRRARRAAFWLLGSGAGLALSDPLIVGLFARDVPAIAALVPLTGALVVGGAISLIAANAFERGELIELARQELTHGDL